MIAPEPVVAPTLDIDQLASIFAAGYVRLLAARERLQDRKNPLDSPVDSKAPLCRRNQRA